MTIGHKTKYGSNEYVLSNFIHDVTLMAIVYQVIRLNTWNQELNNTLLNINMCFIDVVSDR